MTGCGVDGEDAGVLAIAEPGGLGDFASSLARVGVALIAVCLLAAAVLGLLRRRGIGTQARGRSSLRVVSRLALEPGRTLYVVEAAGRFLLVGVGEGPMAVLAELSAEEAKRIEADAGPDAAGVAALLRRAVGG